VAWLRRDNGGSRLSQALTLNFGARGPPRSAAGRTRTGAGPGGSQGFTSVAVWFVCRRVGRWSRARSSRRSRGRIAKLLRAVCRTCVSHRRLPNCTWRIVPINCPTVVVAQLSPPCQPSECHALQQVLDRRGLSPGFHLAGSGSLPCLKVNLQPWARMHFLANGRHVDVVIAAGGGIVSLRSLPYFQANAKARTSFDVEGSVVKFGLRWAACQARCAARSTRPVSPVQHHQPANCSKARASL
jgi:hypothetical protein